MKPSLPRSITIDGPVAAGKTTVGKAVANKLGYLMIDTGFFYRTITYTALEKNIDVRNDNLTGALAENLKIELKQNGDNMLVIVGGIDITNSLRTPQVDKNVSYVAANPRVRKLLTPLIRNITKKNDVVIVGRDIGTVVLPNADLKIWLDASPLQRAKRRTKELLHKGIIKPFEEILKDMQLRDEKDSKRSTAPMKIPKNAVIIDSNNLTIPQTIDKTLSYIYSFKKI